MSVGIRRILRHLSLGLLGLAAFIPLAAAVQPRAASPAPAVQDTPQATPIQATPIQVTPIQATPIQATSRIAMRVPLLSCSQEAKATRTGSLDRRFQRRIFLESTSEPANEALAATRIDIPPTSYPAPPLESAALRRSASSNANRQRAP